MSGKGRKPANHRGGGHKTPPASKRSNGTGGGRSQTSGATATREAARPPAGQSSAAAKAGQRSSTTSRKPSRPQSYPFRESHSRKRRQKTVVWIGIGAILAAAIATIVLGQLGGPSNPPQAAASSSTAAAPSSAAPTTAAVAATTVVPAPQTGPVMVMSCPTGGGASPVFDHQIAKATAPYSITITYGDGDKYTDTDQHLGAVFSHTYKAKGTYTVNAVLTDAAKQTTAASCTYTW